MAGLDLHSVFSNGWTQAVEDQPFNTGLIGSHGWSRNSRKDDDWRNFSSMPNKWFRREEAEYDAESELYDTLLTEAINSQGVPCRYYCVNYNLERDKLLHEDSNKIIQRSFPVQTYFQLPREEDSFNPFGILGLDQFSMFATIRHFNTASCFDQYGKSDIYTPYTPQEGDKIRSEYNNEYYTITQVKRQTNQFHRRVHIWEFIVKPMKDESITVSASISHDDINHEQEINDIFSIGDTVEDEKQEILFDKDEEGVPPDPDNGW